MIGQSNAQYFKEMEQDQESIAESEFLVVRIDGKNFSKLTRYLAKPFDERVTKVMDDVTVNLCASDIPVILAYTQSDEISLLIDGKNAWFGGRKQKIASVCASYASASFVRYAYQQDLPLPNNVGFDARVMSMAGIDLREYFLWRKTDANRNAIAAVAQSKFPHRELQKKSKAEMWEMVNESYPEAFPIDDRNFNGMYMYKTQEESYGDDHIEPQAYRRSSWAQKTDNGMFEWVVNNI